MLLKCVVGKCFVVFNVFFPTRCLCWDFKFNCIDSWPLYSYFMYMLLLLAFSQYKHFVHIRKSDISAKTCMTPITKIIINFGDQNFKFGQSFFTLITITCIPRYVYLTCVLNSHGHKTCFIWCFNFLQLHYFNEVSFRTTG